MPDHTDKAFLKSAPLSSDANFRKIYAGFTDTKKKSLPKEGPLAAVDEFIQGLPRTDEEVLDKAKSLYGSAVDYLKDVGEGVDAAGRGLGMLVGGSVDVPRFQGTVALDDVQAGKVRRTPLPKRARRNYPPDAPGRGVGNVSGFGGAEVPVGPLLPAAASLDYGPPAPVKSPDEYFKDVEVTTYQGPTRGPRKEEIKDPDARKFQREREKAQRDLDDAIAAGTPFPPLEGQTRTPTASQLAFDRRKKAKADAIDKANKKFIEDYEKRNKRGDLTVDIEALQTRMQSMQQPSADLATQVIQYTPAAQRDIRQRAIDRASDEQVLDAYEKERETREKRFPGMGGMEGAKFLGKTQEEQASKARELLRKTDMSLGQKALTELGVVGAEAITEKQQEGMSPATISEDTVVEDLLVTYNPGAALLGLAQEAYDIFQGKSSQLQKLGYGAPQFGRKLLNVFAAPEGEKTGIEVVGDAIDKRIRDPEQLARDLRLLRMPALGEESRSADDFIRQGVAKLPEDLLNLLIAPFMLSYELGKGAVSPASIESSADALGRAAKDMGHMIVEAVADPTLAFQKGPATQAANLFMLGGPTVLKMKSKIRNQRMRLESELQKGRPEALNELIKLERLDDAVTTAQQGLDAAIKAKEGVVESTGLAELGAALEKIASEQAVVIRSVKRQLDKLKKKSEATMRRLRKSEATRRRPGRVDEFKRARQGEAAAAAQASEVSASTKKLTNSLEAFEKSNAEIIRLQNSLVSQERRAKKTELDRIDRAFQKLDEAQNYDEFQSQAPVPDVGSFPDRGALRRAAERRRLEALRETVLDSPLRPGMPGMDRYNSTLSALTTAVSRRNAARTQLILDMRAVDSLVQRSGTQFLMDAGDITVKPLDPVAEFSVLAEKQRLGPKQETDVQSLITALQKTDEAVFGSDFGRRSQLIDEKITAYGNAVRENTVREIRKRLADKQITESQANFLLNRPVQPVTVPDAMLRRFAKEADEQFVRPPVDAADRVAMKRFTQSSVDDVREVVKQSILSGREAAKGAESKRLEFKQSKRDIHDLEFRLRKAEREAKLAMAEFAQSTLQLTGKYRDFASKAQETISMGRLKTVSGAPKKGREGEVLVMGVTDPVLNAASLAQDSMWVEAMLNPANATRVARDLDNIARRARKNLKTERVSTEPVLIDGQYPATRVATLANELLEMTGVVDAKRKELAEAVSAAEGQRSVAKSYIDMLNEKEAAIKQKSRGLGLNDPVSELGLTLVTQVPNVLLNNYVMSLYELGSQFIRTVSQPRTNPKTRYYLLRGSERLSEWYLDTIKERESSATKAEFLLNKALENMPNKIEFIDDAIKGKDQVLKSSSHWMHMQHEAAGRVPTGEPIFGPIPERNLIGFMDTPKYRGFHETKYGRQVALKSEANATYLAERIVAFNEVLRPFQDVSRDITKRAVNQGLFRDPSTLNELWWREGYDPKTFKKMKDIQQKALEEAAKEFPDLAKGIESALADTTNKTAALEISALKANKLRQAAKRWQQKEDARLMELRVQNKPLDPKKNPYRIEAREQMGLLVDLGYESRVGAADMMRTVAEFEFYESLANSKVGTILTQEQFAALKNAEATGRFKSRASDGYLDVSKELGKLGSEWLSTDQKIPRFGQLTGIKKVNRETGIVRWELRKGDNKLYMRADDMLEMLAAQRLQKRLADSLPKALSRWKVWQTSWSPVTFSRNILSNVFMFAPMAGNSILAPSNWPYYAKALADGLLPKGKRSKDWQASYERGVYKNTFSADELKAIQGDLAPMQGGIRNGVDLVTALFETAVGLPNLANPRKTYANLKKATTRAAAMPGKLYGWVDDFFRSAYMNKQLALYRNGKRASLIVDADKKLQSGAITAAEHKSLVSKIKKDEVVIPESILTKIASDAQNKFVNYGDTSGLVQVMRAPVDPLGQMPHTMGILYTLFAAPFVAFPAGAVPLWNSWYKANPLKAQIYHNMARYLTELNRAEQERETGRSGQTEAIAQMMDAAQRSRGIFLRDKFPDIADALEETVVTELGPIKDRIMLDAGYQIPINSYLPDIDMFTNALGLSLAILKKIRQSSGDPLIETAQGLAENQDPFSQRPIADDDQSSSVGETIASIGAFLARTIAPPVFPSISDVVDAFTDDNTPDRLRIAGGRWWEKGRAATEGIRDYKGRRQTPFEFLLETAGVKAQRVLDTEAIASSINELNRQYTRRRTKNIPKTIDKNLVSFSDRKIKELRANGLSGVADAILLAERDATLQMLPRVIKQVEVLAPFYASDSQPQSFGQVQLANATDLLSNYIINASAALSKDVSPEEKEQLARYAVEDFKRAQKMLRKFVTLEASNRVLRAAQDISN